MSTGNSPRVRPAIVLLTGLPGAGKTTFAAALQRRRTVRPLESDAIRRELAPHPAYTRNESARVFDILEARAREVLEAGAVPVIDATNVANADRRRFLRLAREWDAVIVAVRVVAPTSTIRERLDRPREGHSQAGFDIYRRMKPRVEPLPVPTVVVDSRYDLTPSLDLVEILLDAG